MPNIDKNWVIRQLVDNTVDQKVGDCVVSLLKTWSELDASDPDKQQAIVEVFSKLALGHSLVPQDDEDSGTWTPARPGAIKVGDYVMVRQDAYTGELGQLHNGRKGRVVAVRYGDIIINSTDGVLPELKGTHHNPIHLLKMVK